MRKFYLMAMLFLLANSLYAQQNISGIVYDKLSKEPVQGATITGNGSSTSTDAKGFFTLKTASSEVSISAIGYQKQTIATGSKKLSIGLQSVTTGLQEIVLSGSRSQQKRAEVPMAISRLSAQQIKDTRASQFYELPTKCPAW